MNKKPEQSTNNIMNEYMELTKEYQKKYGKQTIVLLQVGAFFEVYGLKNINTNEITESQIEDFSQICQLAISEKKIVYKEQQMVMAGFRDYTLEKYLQRLTENGYTAVVYIQEKEGKIVSRKFHGVYSAGTFVSYETDTSPQLTNNIMCIWLDKYMPITSSSSSSFGEVNQKESIIYGVSSVNIFTGESSIFEYATPFIMNPTTFDELERFVSITAPSELIIVSPFEDSTLQRMIQYTGIKTNSIHKFSSNVLGNNEKVIHCTKQTYIRHILSTFFGEEVLDVCSEFQTFEIATQSFCFLMNFIQEHNPNLVRNISIPKFNNTSERMILANHTLKQLNIIDDITVDSNNSGHLSSVLSFLNKCSTAMGRRRFQDQLLNPTTNKNWLSAEYSMISIMLEPDNLRLVDLVRKQLFNMKDLEKILRQLVIKRIYPSSIYQIYRGIHIMKEINQSLKGNTEIIEYLCRELSTEIGNKDAFAYVDESSDSIIAYLESVMNIDVCKNVNSIVSFEENMIVAGVSEKLDKIVKSFKEKTVLFHRVHSTLNDLFHKNGYKNDIEYIKIHETEKSGATLQITKTRANIMKKIIKQTIDAENENKENTRFVLENLSFEFHLKDIKFTSYSGSNDEIEIPALNNLIREITSSKEKINDCIAETYFCILEQFEDKWSKTIENLATYISKLDVLVCKSYLAKMYRYCKPEIVEDDIHRKSFVQASELRHCLIEHLQKNEIYVSNDISLGDNIDGILLYGTNAVGKTSLIRALGISIIMAQSGMFVPCTHFKYKPYSSIYSRILGNDNIFKGLSTFAVEMSELRIILKMSDENSLILGDELCSGTETESALSIFVAGLTNLHKKQCSFIFATHFHEIIHYGEIEALNRLTLKHMSVIYDREKDCLIYDRLLKEGAGTKTYGLEVCKSLYLEDEFLEHAYSIRNKYFPETNGELSHKMTRYNADKIRGICEICKECIAEEIHHLNEQKNADGDGFIGHFHKNHKANLVSVCEKCHNKMHLSTNTNTKVSKKKKTTNGYLFV